MCLVWTLGTMLMQNTAVDETIEMSWPVFLKERSWDCSGPACVWSDSTILGFTVTTLKNSVFAVPTCIIILMFPSTFRSVAEAIPHTASCTGWKGALEIVALWTLLPSLPWKVKNLIIWIKFCWKFCRLWNCPFICSRGSEITILEIPTLTRDWIIYRIWTPANKFFFPCWPLSTSSTGVGSVPNCIKFLILLYA